MSLLCTNEAPSPESCSSVISKPIPANGPSQSSPIQSLNCGGQSQPGKGLPKLASRLSEITPESASSACLLLSMSQNIRTLRWLDTATPSLLGSETLVVRMRMTQEQLVHYCVIVTPPLLVSKLRRDSVCISNHHTNYGPRPRPLPVDTIITINPISSRKQKSI